MAELVDPTDARNIAMNHAVHLHHTGTGLTGTDADHEQLTRTYAAIYRALTQPVPDQAVTALETRMTHMEERMATLNEEMARIDTETNEIGEDVNAAITEIEALRTRIADLDTAAAAQLGAIADRLSGSGDRLRAVAADPTNPVPEPGPDEPV